MTLERSILEVLDAWDKGAPGKLLPEERLFRDTFLFAEEPTRSEFGAALGELERKRQVYVDRHEDKGRLVQITAQGRARVRT